ncbi:MAG: hypothetical protein H6553_04720 [Chitinophagales bacterium]|nr:hypothetical protein [Chitinophagales bacterium]
MKNIFLSMVLLLSTIVVFAQNDEIQTIDITKVQPMQNNYTYNSTSSGILKTDTLRTYNVYLSEVNTPFGISYRANDKQISYKRYTELKQFWRAIDACEPCLLNTYDIDDNLISSSFQYHTCLCGFYESFYDDGKKKVSGAYLQNTTGNWENMKERGLCNIKTGIWTYYLPNGNIERQEEYQNGVMVNLIKGESKVIPAVDVYNRENNNEDNNASETSEQKGLINKIKNKKKNN